MINDLFTAFWIFLPAGLSTTAAVAAARLPVIKNYSYPLDCNLTYKGRRVFGSHKTVRGLLAGVITAIVVAYLQFFFYRRFVALQSLVNLDGYAASPAWLLGLAGGSGAILGDAVKSFVKRQKGIPPGETWFPFDQLDYIAGGLLFLRPFLSLSAIHCFWIIVIYFLLHPLTTVVGFWLGLKEKPW